MKKFSENQVFTNFLKTHPRMRVDFYTGNIYYNDRMTDGQNVLSGNASLYEMNVDRASDLIYPFITKDAAKNSFSVSTAAAYSALNPGDTITGSYPLTASISRERPMSATYKSALKNTLNYYRFLSPYYNYSYYQTAETNLISIPSIFYGESIKKGSVKLSLYFTGTLISRAEDRGYNGTLIQTFSNYDDTLVGDIVGTVLYNEGFILLTGSRELDPFSDDYYDGSPAIRPKWIHFGPSLSTPTPESGSWVLEFEGTNTISVMTMLCEAGKNEFNFSNNPTFIQSGSIKTTDVQTKGFTQATGSVIKNIVKSDYVSGSEPYAATTYISKVGIYDENKSLIAIAKLARPVKKEEQDSYTFKIAIDL